MARRNGFTLIEVLLVVSLISLLIAMLLPALNKTRETTRRLVCAANIHGMVSGHLKFGYENGGRLVSNQITTGQPGLGGYAIWGSNWQIVDPMGRYRGHGVLASKSIIEPRSMYCPSWTQRMNYNKQDGQGGGWFDDVSQVPSGQVWMQTHYHYRATFGYANTVAAWRPARISQLDGYSSMVADAFSDPARGVNNCHRDGYNHGKVDGSVRFLPDPTHQIRDYYGGISYHAGVADYILIEQVWSTIFDKK